MHVDKNGLNKRLTGDIRHIIQLFAVNEQEARIHQVTHDKVERALKHYGNRYGLQEIGPRVWGPWLASTQPEFVLVDTLYPTGPETGTRLSTMPKAYDPSSIARALMKVGFSGGFSLPPLEPTAIDPTLHYPDDTPPQRAVTSPWPEYPRVEQAGFIPPACLVAIETSKTLPFTLSLPDPTAMSRIQLLATLRQRPELNELMGVLILWAKSWKMDELSTTLLGYLVIRFFQDLGVGKVVQTRPPENNTPEYQTFINKVMRPQFFGIESRVTLFRYLAPRKQSTSQAEEVRDPTAQPVESNVQLSIPSAVVKSGKLLVLFFRYHAERQHIFHLKKKESISAADATLRLWSPRQSHQAPKGGIAGHSRDPFAQEPAHWSRRAMVCVDAFFPHLNQAEGVSWETVRYFKSRAEKAYTLLSTRNPLSAIFGPHLAGLRPQVAGYHTNVRPRATLRPPLPPSEIHQHIDRMRSQTVQRVQAAVERRYGKNYRVELFGSVRYGVCRDTSDLDLAIVDLERMDGFPPSLSLKQLPVIYNVRVLASTLQKAGFRIQNVIPFATVPIVKFIDPMTNLHCDINVNDQLGTINSNLIRLYCDMCPPLREMLKIIKSWAKPIGLNDPSGEAGARTFSSYSLVLMTIGFLQMKGMLPNLQADLGKLDKDDEGDNVFWIRHKSKRLECDIRYHRSVPWTPPSSLPDVEDLLEEWFKYWATEFDYGGTEMNIRLGGAVPLGSNKKKAEEEEKQVDVIVQEFPGEDQDKSVSESEEEEEESELEEKQKGKGKGKAGVQLKLVVPDPFILSKNCTKGINARDIARFQAECQRAVFFATHTSLTDEAFIASGGPAGSDDEDIFPRKLNKKPKRRKPHPEANTGDRRRDGQSRPTSTPASNDKKNKR